MYAYDIYVCLKDIMLIFKVKLLRTDTSIVKIIFTCYIHGKIVKNIFEGLKYDVRFLFQILRGQTSEIYCEDT